MSTNINLDQIRRALKNKTPFQKEDIFKSFWGRIFEDDLVLKYCLEDKSNGKIITIFCDHRGFYDPRITSKISIDKYPEITNLNTEYLTHVVGKVDRSHYENIELIDAELKLIKPRKEMSVKEAFSSKQPLNFIDKPNKSTDKIKKLVDEINDLPKENTFIYYTNLLAHQLRTILYLTLSHYCELKKIGPIQSDGLSYLINYIESNPIKNDAYNKKIIQELGEVKRYKTLTDNVIHDKYTLVNDREVENYITHLKNILSNIYR